MRTKSIILLLIALGFGLVASIGMSQLAGSGETAEIPTAPIYVAITDVAIGDELNEENVKLEQWPADRIPEGGISTPEGLEEMVPTQRMFAGEPILVGKLVNRNQQISAADRIKQGHRVVSVKVAMDTAVSHLILPGDHVDIMSVNRDRGKAETILSNVEVFAINDQTKRMVDEEGGSLQAKTISVQVTPDQAAKLAYHADGANGGRLRLSLRSKDDDGDESGAIDNTPKVDPLLSLRSQIPVQPADDNSFKMQVVGGNGKVQEYTWDDAQSESLPNEVSDGSAPSFGGNGGSPAGSGVRPPFGAGPGAESEDEVDEADEAAAETGGSGTRGSGSR